MMEPGSLGGSNFHPHGNLPGVDGIMSRGEGMHLDKQSSRNDNREKRRRWNMRDFNLIQTVGMIRFKKKNLGTNSY